MRTLLLTLGLILAATAAWADSDFSLRVDVGSSEATYYHGTEWYWGDPSLLTEWNYHTSGLTFGVRDGDWGAHYRYGPGPTFSSPGSWPPPREYQPTIRPADSIIGIHPNDKPGYRVYIPRGLTGEKEYYGDAADVDQGYSYGSLGTRYVPRRHRRGNPVVLQYGYGYYPYYYGSQPLYTAPSNLDYGYTGGVVYRQLPAYDPSLPQVSERQDVRADEVNVYEGDVYNYYYDGQPPPAQPAAPAPPAVESVPPESAPPAEPVPQAVGRRFYERAWLDAPDGVQTFVLENGRLYAGPETGPWLLISELANAGFGAFAAWIPLDGTLVIFREGDRIVAAYPTGGGDWWIEPLPLEVDFSGKITIGLVGGVPWVVADGLDSSRYVMALTGGSWYEVGSATSEE